MLKSLLIRMFAPGDPTDPRIAFRNLRIIHAAFFMSVLIYGLLVYLMLKYKAIPGGGFASDFPNLNALRAAFYMLSAGCFGAIRFIQRRFLTADALRRQDTPTTGTIQTWSVATYALGEASTIFGFILFLIAGFLNDFLVLAGISLVILYWLRPKKDEYHSLVRAAQGT